MWGFLRTLLVSRADENQAPLSRPNYNPDAILEIKTEMESYRVKAILAKKKKNKVNEALNGGVATGLLLALEILDRKPDSVQSL